jgi:hypothetical protein
MARIQFGQSTCQISGNYVPAAEFRLGGGDRIFFSHHVLLWADRTVSLGNQLDRRRLEEDAPVSRS